MGLKQSFNCPQNPQGNGISERINGSIIQLLRMFKNKLNIYQILIIAKRKLNFTIHSIFKYSPHELLFSEIPTHPLKIQSKSLEKALKNSRIGLKLNELKENKCRKEFVFRIGMIIYIRTFRNTKTEDRSKGPYMINEISTDGNRLKIENENENEILWVNIKNVRSIVNSGQCRNSILLKRQDLRSRWFIDY
ncbi:Pro-Pol polyprotein [Dictyocoela muelleri]|nr:Pro-Pol polyprotein [Dictyocoela muelleri]